MHAPLARVSNWLAVPVALLALMGLSAVRVGVPFGSATPDLSGTWPNIGISVSTANGWVVAEGRTEDMNQAIAWRAPLAPMNGPVVVEQAYGSAYVQVGRRQFVIDAATGRTAELRPGQVVRQPWLWGPPAVPAGASDPPREGQAAQASPDPAHLDRKQASVDRLAKESLALSLALSRLDEVSALVAANKATAADLKAAQAAVDNARKAVQLAQANAVTVVAPEFAAGKAAGPAGSTKPSMPQAGPEVQKAQAHVMDLMAQRTKAEAELERLRAGAPTDAQAIEAAQKSVDSIKAQLADADRQLQGLRLVDISSPDANSPALPSIAPPLVDRTRPSYAGIETPAGTVYRIYSWGSEWLAGTPQAAALKAMRRDFAMTEKQPLSEALSAGRRQAIAGSDAIGGPAAYQDLVLRKSDQKVREEHANLPEVRPYPNAAADAYEDLRGLPGFKQTGQKSFEITILVAEAPSTQRTRPLVGK